MNLEERLKSLKGIQPSADYSERSRSFILSTHQLVAQPRFTLRQFIMQNIQLGSAMALTGLLLMLGFGGFSAWKFLSPFGLASLDPANLRAEAEAVNDIGVALNSIQYVPMQQSGDSSALARNAAPSEENTGGSAPAAATLSLKAENASTTEAAAEDAATASSSTEEDFSTTTVDEALDFLLN